MLVFKVQLVSEQKELDEANSNLDVSFGDMLSDEQTAPVRNCMYIWAGGKAYLARTHQPKIAEWIDPGDCKFISVKSDGKDGFYSAQDVKELLELVENGYKINRVWPEEEDDSR